MSKEELVEDLEELVDEFRKTESHGLLPAQRKTAGSNADSLEEVIEENQ